MKKFFAIFLSVILLAVSAALAVGCAFGVEDDDKNDGRTRLKISYYEGGFGGEWMEQIAAAFEKEHPDVKVVLDGDYKMENYIGPRLENAENGGEVADIYTTFSRANFTSFAQKGYLEDLSDLYERETPDGVKLKDVILPEAMETGRIGGEEYWGVPWSTSVSGIVYNAKLFEENGWNDSPETLEEFLQLCQTIADAKVQHGNVTVAPLVYSGATEQGYCAHLLKSWFRMYQGETGFNTFYRYESAQVYSMEGRLKAYEALAQVLGGGYAMTGSTTLDYMAAQRTFIQGQAAMITAGSWLETEMSGFLEGYPDFEMKIMAMPKIYASKSADGKYLDLEGKEVQHINSGSADNFIIPKRAKQKELAKEFLLFMASQDMLTLYSQYTNSPRPYKYENTDWSTLSVFGQSAMEVYQQSVTVSPFSTALIATENKVQEYMGSSYATDLDRFNTGSLAGSLQKAKDIFDNEIEIAEERFKAYLG